LKKAFRVKPRRLSRKDEAVTRNPTEHQRGVGNVAEGTVGGELLPVATGSADEFNAILTPLKPNEPCPGVLSGRRLLVKDLIDIAGVRTTYGSRIYADHVPMRTASCVEKLVRAGAVVVGKASLPEFAWNVTGQNPWYGDVHNPAHPGRTTGGSSSGNAAALAANLCDLGLGTDTGCSIRLPSACCGTVGLKPSWSSIPMDGIFPLCPTVDTVGPMARTVEDVALAWSVLTERPVPEPRLRGCAVGVLTRPPSLGDGNVAVEETLAAEAWVAELERLGARVVHAHIPDPDANTEPVLFHEALRSHRETYPARRDDYSDNVRAKLEWAQRIQPHEVATAYAALDSWRSYRPDVDLFVSPCYAIDLPAEDCDELEVRLPLAAFLRPINMLGWAALAIGNMQFIAPHDKVVLAAGLAWERG
jgi:aspartyl-tRNA(Asn)/glutamyl-tRNA(Gln) amidotransferase subunit A